ncbi:MAG TPA: hypothetical protein VJV75_06115, partial [Candidatus Polarisedimenticolia bacterium]|nr:hypothetical protein [Candidatus Polarisedimenticolia bacterium]
MAGAVGGDAPRRRAEDRPATADLHRQDAPRLRGDGVPPLNGTTPGGPERVLLLLPTTTYKAADFLAAADRIGVTVVVGSERRQALESVAPGGTLALPFDDPEAAARAIVAAAGNGRKFAAVVPTDDLTAEIAARAQALLGLPHNP